MGTTIHPVSALRWKLINSSRKMSNFQKCSKVRPRSELSIGQTRKPIGDYVKIQRDEKLQIEVPNLLENFESVFFND